MELVAETRRNSEPLPDEAEQTWTSGPSTPVVAFDLEDRYEKGDELCAPLPSCLLWRF